MIKPFNHLTVQRVKAYAFTLAETLIVIGIIGVVAALTLPNLNHATGDKEKVTRVKKVYSAITEAFDRAQVVYGPMEEWFVNDTTDAQKINKFATRITEFMKVSKNCENSNSGCYSTSDITGAAGGEFSAFSGLTNLYSVILSDGTSLIFIDAQPEPSYIIVFDIDGPKKGKNQIANDLFAIINDGLPEFKDGVNVPSPPDEVANCRQGIAIDGDYGNARQLASCTAWVLENGNLDYLKTDSNDKCPNGTKLGWEDSRSCN